MKVENKKGKAFKTKAGVPGLAAKFSTPSNKRTPRDPKVVAAMKKSQQQGQRQGQRNTKGIGL